MGLFKIYTNHCIRCTTVSKAKSKGLSNSDVCTITGHKNEGSIPKYDRPSDQRKRALCAALDLPGTSSDERILQQTDDSDDACTPMLKLALDESKSLRVNRSGARNQGEEEQRESEKKKARLITSWGILEIDL